ncbi:MAG: hypothetical protein A2V64_00120 [Bacteroidetes bacterium RBG_13_43_22]|nr:MAG: hypothetical protein A2V64_00120 [Bacteroidetes bacterium RBG_13_43_22]
MNKISGEKLDCAFIFPPGGGFESNFFFYNIGSAYIISFLRQHGYKAEQYVCREHINLENCVKEIIITNPRVVGFTVFNTNFLTSILIARQIRAISPKIIIVFGGPAATSYSEFILNRYPFIDACFRNEGEETFLQFLSRLTESKFDFVKTDLGNIKGVTYRYEDSVIINPDSNILAENSIFQDYLDKYPSPYLSGIIPGADAFTTGLLTARGCNQHCIYCNCAVLSKRKITTHSVERVISELDYLSGYSDEGRVLNFYDDAFSLIQQRAKTICKTIIENRIRISLSCITRCDCADEELLDLMKEAGFISIAFSLESATPKILRIIGKVHKAEDNPSDALEKETMFIEKFGKMTAYAKKIGIRKVFSSVMTGLPGETLEEANKTIEKIDSCHDIDSYSQNLFTIYHGTPLYDTYRKYGYKVDFPDNNPVFSRTIYPDDVVYKVKISSKSQFHETQKSLHNSTLRILSLAHEKNCKKGWFNNVILFSDTADRDFVDWLKMILAINGTIIQIYSDETALSGNSDKNHENYIRYCTPSLNIRDCYLERDGNLLLVCYRSPLLRSVKEKIVMKICDFKHVKTNLTNPEVDFIKVMCKESDSNDAGLAYTYFSEVKKEKDLFNYLINKKPFPYFANLCKWTKDLANCSEKNTLFVNDRSEVRLCWYGQNIGKAGQTYNTLIKNFEYYQQMISEQRKCNICNAKDHCNKCISPFPLSDEEFCSRQIGNDISSVAELYRSVDAFKQYIR